MSLFLSTNCVFHGFHRLCSFAATVAGLYCVGWLKRGPSGIIGTNIGDARETTSCILEDVARGAVAQGAPPRGGMVSLVELLVSRGRRREELVDWTGFKSIDKAEQAKGARLGKPREKLVTMDELLGAVQHREQPDGSCR